jgi:hypothetical protein
MTGAFAGSFFPDMQVSGSLRSQTIPQLSGGLLAPACPFPSDDCGPTGNLVRTYGFQMAAHNAIGYDSLYPQSSALKPLVSYKSDNVHSIRFSTTTGQQSCVACHVSPNPLILAVDASTSYSSIKNFQDPHGTTPLVPVSRPVGGYPYLLGPSFFEGAFLLLGCPVNACNYGAGPVPHPGGANFARGSMQYNLILQWIKDGALP